jgi:hypothetical protein
MPRYSCDGIAETNSPHAAEESWPARTHPRKTRMGLETIRCRIEERTSRLASARFLLHFDAPGITQFVTFQLHDSFPVTRRAEFEAILNEPDDSTKRRKLEAWLDRGHGECWLQRRDVAEIVEMILLEADGRDYRI